LTLCDQHAQPITKGSLDAPLATTVVSSIAAPGGYGVPGGTATLFAYQPRQGVAPSDWSGDSLTASSRYTSPSHPAAKLTPADPPPRGFVNAYPPRWGGFVELRLYLGAPDQPALTESYAAADIQVVGDTWQLVRGGASCAGAQATSIEELLPSQDPAKTVAQAAGAAAIGNGPGGNGSGTGGAPTTTTPVKTATGPVTVRPVSSSSPARWLRIAVPAAGLALAFGLFARRFIQHRPPSQATT
ncbi:MAG: hypothetical protein JO265_10875, partial [Acidimicrobiia bacterium]|nr:hypothetical protein [Acidimicrobiia bacterium]